MDDPNKKVIPEEAADAEKAHVPDDEAEKVAGGAHFDFYDREKRIPK